MCPASPKRFWHDIRIAKCRSSFLGQRVAAPSLGTQGSVVLVRVVLGFSNWFACANAIKVNLTRAREGRGTGTILMNQ